jgi:hypothetical protein
MKKHILKKHIYIFSFVLALVCVQGTTRVCAAEKAASKEPDGVTLTQLYREFKVFEARTDERFVAIEKRFDQVDKRFSDLYTVLTIIAASFTTLAIAMISIIFWDRKTAITKSVEESLKRTREFAADRDTTERMLAALRELAKTNSDVAETLKRFNLL